MTRIILTTLAKVIQRHSNERIYDLLIRSQVLTRPIQNPFETMTPKMTNYQIIILIRQGFFEYI